MSFEEVRVVYLKEVAMASFKGVGVTYLMR